MARHARVTGGGAQRMATKPINSYRSAWLDHWKLSTGGSMAAHLKDAVSVGPGQLMTPDKFPEKNHLVVSTSLQRDKQLGPSILLHGSKNKWPPSQRIMHQEGGICQPGPVTASNEHLRDAGFCSSSTFSVHGKKTGGALEVGKLESRVTDKNYDHLAIHGPSAHVNLLQNVVGVETVSGHSTIRMLPPREHHLGARKLDELYQQYVSLPKVPLSFHDVEATPLALSPRVHEFWFKRTTDPKIYEVGNVQKESTISARFNGEMVAEFLCLSPSFGFPDKQRAKLQAFGSSIDDEATGDVNHSLVLQNESSAETDTMEMDAFQKGHISGMASGPLNQNNTKVQHSLGMKTASPALASSVSDKEHSTSRSQSLDAEHLFSPAEQATTCKGAGVCNSYPGPGPSARWIKRLKLGTSDTLVHGTKSLEMCEASSHEKAGKMFGRIMKRKVSSSLATDGRTHTAPDHASLLKKVSSSSTGSGSESGEITLSHFWIQRWCNNRVPSSEKGPKAGVRSEQQSSKAMINEMQNKLSPSIGAMALMGKALTGSHRCEIRKKHVL